MILMLVESDPAHGGMQQAKCQVRYVHIRRKFGILSQKFFVVGLVTNALHGVSWYAGVYIHTYVFIRFRILYDLFTSFLSYFFIHSLRFWRAYGAHKSPNFAHAAPNLVCIEFAYKTVLVMKGSEFSTWSAHIVIVIIWKIV